MNNSYYVRPLGGIDPSRGIMQGLAIADRREETALRQQALEQRQAAADRQAAVQQAIAEAYQSGDPARMREVIAMYPDEAKGLADSLEWQEEGSQKMMQGAWTAIYQNPEKAADILQTTIAQGQANGWDMSQSQRDLEELQAGGLDTDQVKGKAGTALLMSGGVDTWDKLQDEATRPPAPTEIEKLLAARDKYPEGHPNRATIEAIIAKKTAPDDRGGLTPAQIANNAEIDSARRQLEGMSKEDALLKSTEATATGRTNPDYDPFTASLVKKATQRKVGEDPGFESVYDKFYGQEQAAPAADSEREAQMLETLRANNLPDTPENRKKAAQKLVEWGVWAND